MSRRHLVAVVVVVTTLIAINLFLWRIGATTSLRYTRMMMAGQASADSWRPMSRALDAWNAGEPVYGVVFFRDRQKFQYPPSSLLVPLAVGGNHDGDLPLFRALNRLGLWATLVMGVATAFIAAHTWRTDRSAIALARLAAGVVLAGASVLFFFPVTISYVLGQIQTLVNASIAVALACWLRGWDRSAGVAIGLAALIKPHFGLLLIWGMTRRRWRFASAGVATVAVGSAVALVIFGLGDHLDYARVLGYLGARGEAFYSNQTVNGLLNRLVQPPEHRGWDFHSYPPPHPLVAAGTWSTSLLLVAAAFWWPRRLGFAGSALDLAIVWLSVTMASPIAWDHHYGGLLPILVMGAGAAWATGPRWTVYALAAAAVMTGNLWEPLIDIETPPWNVVQSYVLAGSLVTLAVLYRLGAAAGHPAVRVGD